LHVLNVQTDTGKKPGQPLGVRQSITVTVDTFLNGLSAEEVRVEAMYGQVNQQGKLTRSGVSVLTCEKDLGDGKHQYKGSITPEHSGKYGFAIRIVPGGEIFE